MTKKYIKDYKFSESVTERGRIKTEAVYVGSYYRFTDPELGGRLSRQLLPACVLLWAVFFAALIPESSSMRRMFVALPYAFTALPLGLLTGTAWRIRTQKQPFIHSDSDKISTRGPASMLFTMLLAGVSFLGAGIAALVRPESLSAGDALFIPLSAVLTVLSALVFTRRKGLKTEVTK